jgi:hypothetical protein
MPEGDETHPIVEVSAAANTIDLIFMIFFSPVIDVAKYKGAKNEYWSLGAKNQPLRRWLMSVSYVSGAFASE